MKGRTKFISVEVVIKTDCPHEAFVEWFAAQDNPVEVLPCETHRSYIYFAPLPCSTVDETVRRICQQIAALPALPRQQWDAAGFREFFIGYELGEEPFCFEQHLSHETLAAAAALGAGIGLALYQEHHVPSRERP